MVNEKFKRPQRVADSCKPTATYDEPPVPLNENTSAFLALKELMETHTEVEETINVMDLL